MGGLRWSVVVAIAAAVIAGTTAAADNATAAASARTCSPPGAQTLAQDLEARVYSIGGGSGPLLAPSGRLYGCLTRSGHTVSLGSRSARERLSRVTLTGHMVALARQFMGVDTLSSTVQAVDLTSGRTLHQEAATGPVLAPESAVVVHGLALDALGNLGWLASQASIVGHSTRYEVHRVNRAGAALLDAGPAIAPGSLRRRGELMMWRDGAGQRSARLD